MRGFSPSLPRLHFFSSPLTRRVIPPSAKHSSGAHVNRLLSPPSSRISKFILFTSNNHLFCSYLFGSSLLLRPLEWCDYRSFLPSSPFKIAKFEPLAHPPRLFRRIHFTFSRLVLCDPPSFRVRLCFSLQCILAIYASTHLLPLFF